MKKRFLAVLAACALIFSAGMPVYNAHADSYGEIIDAGIDEDGNISYDSEQETVNDYSETNSSSYSNDADRVKTIGICIVIGLVIGGIATMVMVSSMRSVHRQTGASDYKKPNSFKLDLSQDTYLYNKIEKVQISQPSQNQNNNH